MTTHPRYCALLGALLLSLLSQRAEASSVAGCKLEAAVLEVRAESKDKKEEIILKLKAIKGEPFGNASDEATCDPPGTEIRFAVDNDEDVREAGIKAGDTVLVEHVRALNRGGPVTVRKFIERRKAAGATHEQPEASKDEEEPATSSAENPASKESAEEKETSTPPKPVAPNERGGAKDAGGCQISSPEASPPAWVLFALALGLLWRRRATP